MSVLFFSCSHKLKHKKIDNVSKAVIFLNQKFPDSIKAEIASFSDTTKWRNGLSYYNSFPPSEYIIGTPYDVFNNNKRLFESFESDHISMNQIYDLTLKVLHHKLNGRFINYDSLVVFYENQYFNNYIDNEFRYNADSINNKYIPKDLEDCFKQIDIFWADSTKENVKKMTESDFSTGAHFGFGLWMRNNWSLWGGSRLSRYFNNLGVYHPDDMSGIILDSYYRYLSGKPLKLKSQIKNYKR